MPAIQAISLAKLCDFVMKTTSATVSTDRTFLPAGKSTDGIVRYESRGEGIPVGFPTITVMSRRPVPGSQYYKVKVQLKFPTLEVLGVADSGYQAANKKAYEQVCNMEFLMHERGTTAQRNEFFSLVTSLFATTITASDADPSTATLSPIKALVVDLDGMYA